MLDTAADLAAAANAMRADAGLPPLPRERIEQFVGKGLDVLVHRAMTDSLDGTLEPRGFAAARDAFARHYAVENGRHAQPYPGALAGLQALRDMRLRLACVTNKPGDFTWPLLQRWALDRQFDLIVTADAVGRRKPDPLPMLHVAQRFALPAECVVVIGDSSNDVAAARAAGMPVIAVRYGYNEGRDPDTLDADALVDSLLEAAALIDPQEPLAS